MAVIIAGEQFWLWRAVDDEGEVLDLLVQRRRGKAAAVKLMRKLMKKQGVAPDVLVTNRRSSTEPARNAGNWVSETPTPGFDAQSRSATAILPRFSDEV